MNGMALGTEGGEGADRKQVLVLEPTATATGPGVEARDACCITNRSTSTVAEGSDTAKTGSW